MQVLQCTYELFPLRTENICFDVQFIYYFLLIVIIIIIIFISLTFSVHILTVKVNANSYTNYLYFPLFFVCKRQNEIMQKLIMYRANVITFDRFIQNAFSIRLIIIYRKKYSQFMSNVLNKWGTLGTFTHRWCICLFSSFFPAIALVQCVRNGWVCEFADLSIYLLLFFFCV